MSEPYFEPHPGGTPLPGPYAALLERVAAVAARSVDRMRRLCCRYPDDVPAPVLEQLRHPRAHPTAERREAVRLPGVPGRVLVGAAGGPADAAMIDCSEAGLGLRVGTRLALGEVVAVRVPGPGGERWLAARVRHCRPSEGEWVAGCVLVADLAPS